MYRFVFRKHTRAVLQLPVHERYTVKTIMIYSGV